MTLEQTYIVRLEYGPYTYREAVVAEDEEQAIAKAWARLRRQGWLTLPMAYTSATVESVNAA